MRGKVIPQMLVVISVKIIREGWQMTVKKVFSNGMWKCCVLQVHLSDEFGMLKLVECLAYFAS